MEVSPVRRAHFGHCGWRGGWEGSNKQGGNAHFAGCPSSVVVECPPSVPLALREHGENGGAHLLRVGLLGAEVHGGAHLLLGEDGREVVVEAVPGAGRVQGHRARVDHLQGGRGWPPHWWKGPPGRVGTQARVRRVGPSRQRRRRGARQRECVQPAGKIQVSFMQTIWCFIVLIV